MEVSCIHLGDGLKVEEDEEPGTVDSVLLETVRMGDLGWGALPREHVRRAWTTETSLADPANPDPDQGLAKRDKELSVAMLDLIHGLARASAVLLPTLDLARAYWPLADFDSNPFDMSLDLTGSLNSRSAAFASLLASIAHPGELPHDPDFELLSTDSPDALSLHQVSYTPSDGYEWCGAVLKANAEMLSARLGAVRYSEQRGSEAVHSDTTMEDDFSILADEPLAGPLTGDDSTRPASRRSPRDRSYMLAKSTTILPRASHPVRRDPRLTQSAMLPPPAPPPAHPPSRALVASRKPASTASTKTTANLSKRPKGAAPKRLKQTRGRADTAPTEASLVVRLPGGGGGEEEQAALEHARLGGGCRRGLSRGHLFGPSNHSRSGR